MSKIEEFENLEMKKVLPKGMTRSFTTNAVVWEAFVELAKREGMSASSMLTDLMIDFVRKHSKSNNPQSLIDTYSAEYMMAIPHLLTTLEMGGQAKVRQVAQKTPTAGLKDIETALHDWTWEIRKELARR